MRKTAKAKGKSHPRIWTQAGGLLSPCSQPLLLARAATPLQGLRTPPSGVRWPLRTTRVRLCDAMDYPVRGILQAKILEWVAFPFPRGSSQPMDWAQFSHTAGGFFTSWATREARYEVINSTLRKKNKEKLRILPNTEPHELTFGVDFPTWDFPASRMIFACWVFCFSLSCQYE